MKRVYFEETLFEEMEPLISIGRETQPHHPDPRQLLCVAIFQPPFDEAFLIVPLAEEILEQVRQGQIDVRSACLLGDANEWYIAEMHGFDEAVQSMPSARTPIPEEYLAAPGLFVTSDES